MKTLLIIFGASGDLTFRKLLPASYNLYKTDAHNELQVLGVARRETSREDYISKAKTWIEEFSRVEFKEDEFEAFSKSLQYYQMDISKEDEYLGLKSYIKENYQVDQMIYYLAVAPSLFLPITQGLVAARMNLPKTRVIVEKPFGENIEKATELNNCLVEAFGNSNIYHIDHYLGKEMIQNILSIRFKNIIFKHIWNKDFIDSVQISAFEEVGVGTRGGYYDHSGAMKDMVQNHLLQVLSIVAMEEPKEATPEEIHQEQLTLLQSLVPIPKEEVNQFLVLGQYEGYLDEVGVDAHSKTETYAALKVNIDNDRWRGVPFVIRTGKALHKRETEIIIQFKSADETVFGDLLMIKVQPREGVYLEFNIKKPGTTNEDYRAQLDYTQSDLSQAQANTPEAYERLLNAAIYEDGALFSKWEQIMTSWAFTNRVMEGYEELEDKKLYIYPKGSEGPDEALALLEALGCPVNLPIK